MSTELVTQEYRELLDQARSQSYSMRLPLFPTIKLVNNMSKIEGMKMGDYCLSRSVKNPDTGDWETKEENIGRNPVITTLSRRYVYSFFSKKEDRLMAWTNELKGFNSWDMVYLISAKSGTPQLEAALPYPQFKEYRKEKYTNPVDGKNLLTFRNAFYVLHEGEIFRMFVSNASMAGIAEGQDAGDFKNPQPGSFIQWEKELMATGRHAHFEHRIRLGSETPKGKDFMVMTFEDAGAYETKDELEELVRTWRKTEDDLETRFKIEFGQYVAHSDTSKVTAGSPTQAPDDLPDL